MSKSSSELKAWVFPFAAFMFLIGAREAIQSMANRRGPFFLAEPQYWIYPAQTLLCAALLWRFWACYRFAFPKKVGFALAIAVLVLGVWISPQELFGAPRRHGGFDPGVFGEGGTLFAATLALRFARLVVVVPLVEEIFWRGFLLRYLIDENFEKVPPGAFSWFSFCAVTICFGLAHWGPDFVPALVAGALFNVVMYRTRSLSSCVVAHSATNLLLGVYIMLTQQWGFW
jgi:CAAX protease family protein